MLLLLLPTLITYENLQKEYYESDRANYVKSQYILCILLHFGAFFHVASLLSTGVDNEKALVLDNRIIFFIFQPDFNIEIIEISPKNATKHPVA